MIYDLISGGKILDNFKTKISSIRTGRVNSSVLDNVLVEAYGSHMSIKEIATVTAPEPTQLLITPFDKSLISAIEKAITQSNLGSNPNSDGAGIRLVFPPLTAESRAIKAKEVGKDLEEAKIAVRNQRQDLLKHEKRRQENDEISEDELRGFETDLQKEVDAINKELEVIGKAKEDEIMKI
jgi:ribosome recycling factor